MNVLKLIDTNEYPIKFMSKKSQTNRINPCIQGCFYAEYQFFLVDFLFREVI